MVMVTEAACSLVFVQMLPGSLHNMRKLTALFSETRALLTEGMSLFMHITEKDGNRVSLY